MEYLKYKDKFFVILENLMDDIISIFPDDYRIQRYKTLYSLAKDTNSKLIISQFYQHVVMTNKDRILNREEDYFKRGGGQERLTEEEKMKYVDFIIDKWNVLTDDNKNVIWDYFKILIKLTELYVENKGPL